MRTRANGLLWPSSRTAIELWRLKMRAVRGTSPRHPWGQLAAITLTRPTSAGSTPEATRKSLGGGSSRTGASEISTELVPRKCSPLGSACLTYQELLGSALRLIVPVEYSEDDAAVNLLPWQLMKHDTLQPQHELQYALGFWPWSHAPCRHHHLPILFAFQPIGTVHGEATKLAPSRFCTLDSYR